MEQIKEKHENPTIKRVSDSLGVHQPENATETNGLSYVAYLASWSEFDKKTWEEECFEQEEQEWCEVSELPARLEYLRENAEGCNYRLSDCRVSLAEYSQPELTEENISRIGTCVLLIRENEKFYYSTAEEARETLLGIFRKHRIPLPNEIQYVIGGYYVKWNLEKGFSGSEILLWKFIQRTLHEKLAKELGTDLTVCEDATAMLYASGFKNSKEMAKRAALRKQTNELAVSIAHTEGNQSKFMRRAYERLLDILTLWELRKDEHGEIPQGTRELSVFWALVCTMSK